jgi:hypothetical protein
MAIFNSKLLNYQRVKNWRNWCTRVALSKVQWDDPKYSDWWPFQEILHIFKMSLLSKFISLGMA